MYVTGFYMLLDANEDGGVRFEDFRESIEKLIKFLKEYKYCDEVYLVRVQNCIRRRWER